MAGSVGSAARAALYASKARPWNSSACRVVFELLELPRALLVGQREIHLRDRVIREQAFQRPEDLDGDLRFAVAGLQDPDVGELGLDIGLHGEHELPVVVRVRVGLGPTPAPSACPRRWPPSSARRH